MARGSLDAHHQTQNIVEKGELEQESNKEGGGEEPRVFMMLFPEKAGPIPCPVEGCMGQAATRTAIRMHFWHRHVRDTVVILEEVNPPPTTVTSV